MWANGAVLRYPAGNNVVKEISDSASRPISIHQSAHGDWAGLQSEAKFSCYSELRDNENKPQTKRRELICEEKKTGRVVLREKVTGIHEFRLAGNSVYFIDHEQGDGQALSRVDLTTSRQSKVDVGFKIFFVGLQQHIGDAFVYVEGDHRVAAIRADSGSQVWSLGTRGSADTSASAVLTDDGTVFVAGYSNLAAYRLLGGR